MKNACFFVSLVNFGDISHLIELLILNISFIGRKLQLINRYIIYGLHYGKNKVNMNLVYIRVRVADSFPVYNLNQLRYKSILH